MRLKRRFPVLGADGRQDEVLVYVRDIDTSSLSERSSREGLPEFRTANGMRLNWLERGRYEVVQTGEMLVSDHPDAL